MRLVLILFCLSVIWQLGLSRSNLIRKRRRIENIEDAEDYLKKYGYMDVGMTREDENTTKESLKTFQKFNGLNQTGKLDYETKHLMEVPRCGVKDNPHSIQRRYVLRSPKWPKLHLKYRINSYPTINLRRDEVDKAIEQAFEIWAKHCPRTFEKVSSEADIDIEFVRGDHGDGTSFDGPGGFLAHAFGYHPNHKYGGDVHFDDEDPFNFESETGKDLLYVALHEIGHSLGLGHSNVYNSIMYPFFKSYIPNLDLHLDDIQGIQSLYGNPGASPTVTKTTENDLCQDPTFDDITLIDHERYVFKGEYCYKLNLNGGFVFSYPKKISEEFPGIPTNIDAAYSIKTPSSMETYIIKGGLYYKMVGRNVQSARLISTLNPKVPRDIDGAFYKNGLYIIKDGSIKKCRLNTFTAVCTRVTTDPPIRPYAAFRDSNDNIYFFVEEDKYYRSNNVQGSHITMDLLHETGFTYPLSTRRLWFGCKNELRMSTLETEERRIEPSGNQWHEDKIEVGAEQTFANEGDEDILT